MTSRPTQRQRPHRGAARPAPARSGLPVVPLAIGALLVVTAIALVVALSGSDSDPASTDAGVSFGPVIVNDPPLETLGDTDPDPAVGQVAPLVELRSPTDTAVTIGGPGDGAAGEPTLVAFLAHWCPHCQAEVPVLVDLAGAGAFDGVRLVAVLTGTDAAAPNFPPVAWLEREGWTGEVALDDERASAARAFGLSSYPFLVFLDADGDVVARTAGEVGAAEIERLVTEARA